ncbi:beta-amyrin 28-monooxygenase-like [Carya illinoinensis]|uniref:Cytochrome P450 n=1 Tax=Carya illinoinensis TaxID=32201 RepID=A0A8T1N6P7_CARIL|nr:beta-amyrin 28-monooxygenase-like [Carya illinoinensis]KAG6625712.1 hypothetical protein CIPAW_16G117300 [Carya illinoinensis]
MDIFFSSLYLIQFVILCISLLLIIFSIYKRKSPSPKLPPGRRGWPIVGETLEYVRACKSGEPEKFIIDRMSNYSTEVFQTSLFGENLLVFCGASGNKFMFSSANKHVTPWWPRSISAALNFPSDMAFLKDDIAKLRAMLPEFLKPEALQRYIPIMDSMAKEHLETSWSPYNEVMVFPLTKEYTIAVACRVFINIKDLEHITRFSNLFSLITKGILSAPIKLPGTAFSHAVREGKLLHEEFLGIIRDRKMELLEKKVPAKEDLLSRMLLVTDHENGRGMNEKLIASQIIGFFIGSYITTSSTITSILRYLAEFPNVYNKVLKEQMEIAKSKGPGELLSWEDIKKMKYSWNVACEAMRLAPPIQGAFREVTTEFTYAGSTIPKGWKAYWTVASTHKNPKYFPDPEKFDPSRFEGNGPAPYTFVPFGGGPHMCLGKEYSRLEILTFIHNVVTKYKWEKVNANEKIVFNPAPSPVNGLLVRIEPLIKN